MGIVHEAFDAERQAHVALKTMRALDGDTLARFEQEFRAAHEVRHPNLVELVELGFEGGVWFLTMEIVLGCDFLEYVRPGYAPLAPFRPSIRRSSTGADAGAESCGLRRRPDRSGSRETSSGAGPPCWRGKGSPEARSPD
jgi:hypothetical protein